MNPLDIGQVMQAAKPWRKPAVLDDPVAAALARVLNDVDKLFEPVKGDDQTRELWFRLRCLRASRDNLHAAYRANPEPKG